MVVDLRVDNDKLQCLKYFTQRLSITSHLVLAKHQSITGPRTQIYHQEEPRKADCSNHRGTTTEGQHCTQETTLYNILKHHTTNRISS